MQNDQANNPSQAINIISIENLINNHNLKLNTLQSELKEHKQMLNSLLENNDEYQRLNEEALKASKLKNLEKQKALKDPNAASLQEKINDIQGQLREIKSALSDYLGQYVALSGSNKLESPDGTMLNIIYTAKLVKEKTND